MSKISVSGTIVLYNPDSSVLDNIATYIDYIDKLYAVDNSDDPDLKILSMIKKMTKVIYVPLSGNLGVGKALNTAATIASDQRYQWLLTMDQDTKVSDNIVDTMLKCLNHYKKDEIGIISSRYTHKNLYVEKQGHQYNELFATITSGNLLNLKNYQTVGPFLEKLFIDQVDHEYCMRLRKNGYKVIQANNAFIHHKMGNKKKHILGNCTHYNSVRRYFITRNRFYVVWLYKNDFPEFYRYELITFLKELVKIFFYEKDKLKKYRNIILGFLDFKNNNFDRKLWEL